MNNSPKTEPTAIIASMALTALAAGYTDLTTSIWVKIVSYLILILAGTSATQLYWSLIIPQLRNELDDSLTREVNFKGKILVRLVGFYFRVSARFFIAQCTIKEMRLLGYINGMIAFLIFFVAKLLNLIKLGFIIQ